MAMQAEAKQRVSTAELRTATLPGTHLIIVENENCLHQLPPLSNTLAVLGSGLDVSWTTSTSLHEKRLAYWGDIDTWGLKCLAQARTNLPRIEALMMTREVYETHKRFAIPEPITAGDAPPQDLNATEQMLYHQLLQEERGRLEQEFLPASFVTETILHWHERPGSKG